MLLNDRYEYNPDTDLIGRGGLAEVFKAYDRQRACYVALKKFQTADSLKYGIRDEFQKSIHFAHGNIVRAFDFFTLVQEFKDGGTHETQYGVMELVEGGDLADYLKTKPSNSELLEVVKGILRGLDYLHTPDPNTNKGSIIHRDIKPGNILIFYNHAGKPIPKIADFNVAKEVSGNLESSVSMVGTYEYMAPEQLNVTKYGINDHVHANADLWALGVILCDYFMGKSLFGKRSEGNTQGQIIGKILDEPIPAEAIKKLPAPFNGIIAQCLVRFAKDRVQGAGELMTYISKIGELETTVVGADKKVEVEVNKPKCEPRPKGNNDHYIFGIVTVLVFLVSYFFILFLGLVPKDLNEQIANQMVLVLGGKYKMGCTSEQGSDCENNEKPTQHKAVSTFMMGKYEVTQLQWRAVMGNNPSYNSGCNECPVEQVNYDDIQEFLRKLNIKTGKKYRLPTEVEWEYAARGGNKSSSYRFSGSNNIGEVGWYTGNFQNSKHGIKGTTHPVGTKKANELGLFDMSGNVWDWCSDWYKGYPGSIGVSDYTGLNRVLRGGGWVSNAQNCRVTNRYGSIQDFRDRNFGFRLVEDP